MGDAVIRPDWPVVAECRAGCGAWVSPRYGATWVCRGCRKEGRAQ